MSEIIAITNQKGGVGKTTTAVNLAACLALLNKRVLLIDLDPQANATQGLGFYKNKFEYNIYHVLTGRVNINDAILKTEIKTLFFLPSGIALTNLEQKGNEEPKLRKKIKAIKTKFDFIIIDCPPTLGPITVSALSACDSVLIPIQCEFYALEGLGQMLNTIRLIKQSGVNDKIRIRGFLPTMYSQQNNLSKESVAELHKNFANRLIKSKNEQRGFVVIPRNIKLAESPSYGKPVALYDAKSAGCVAYTNLAKAILE